MGHPPFISLRQRFSQMAGGVKGISALRVRLLRNAAV
jgi:hypothetical protein